MPDDMPLPSKDIAFELLKILKVPYQVRRHSLKVSEKALELAEKITKNNINLELVEIGALLHDVGRSKTHGFKHGIIGGKILRERGFPKELARICETHILGGLDKDDTKNLGLPQKDYIPQTLVSIEQRFEKWFLKYGKTEILIKSKERIQLIQEEIASLI